jgi:ribA/ribD-fused uncharacterized protein
MNAISAARDVQALRACMAQGLEPRFLFFWGHQAPKDGQVGKSCFSQWYEAPFTTGGQRYGTAEHFMMAEKARLFGDEEIRRRILHLRTPGEAKKLGREIAGFDEPTWVRERFGVVVAANLQKFGQNPALRDFLVQTGDRVLVEASPVDSIWGIGLAGDHADAALPDRWPGLNLLGFALMEVRERLLHA